MTTYNITQSNLLGFPGLDAATPSPTFQTIIRPVLEFGDEFGVDLNFAYAGDDRFIDMTVNLTGFSPGFPIFNVTQVNNKTFRIRGQAKDIFLNQYYEFLMPDLKTIRRLPANTTERVAALVTYEPPSPARVTRTHTISFRINYIPNPNFGAQPGIPGDPNAVPPIPDVPPVPPSPVAPLTINTSVAFSQDVVWWYDRAVIAFQNALSKGTI